MQIKSFAKMCNRMLTDWSRREVDEMKDFKSIPASPKLNTEVSAYHYLRKPENKDFIQKQIVYGSYVVRGAMSADMRFSKWSRRLSHPSKFKSFAEFFVWSRAFYTVEKYPDGFLKCSCPIGSKKYVCKHSVAVDIVKNKFQLNPLAKSLPIGYKRGRGRPKKVGLALSLN
jgi:hypothetical protein